MDTKNKKKELNKSSEYRFASVMIVEDNPTDIFILEKTLDIKNFAREIIKYTSVAEALDYIRVGSKEFPEKMPELIFLDVNIPGMGGLEFLKQLKSFSPNNSKKFKVIVLSCSDNQDIIMQVEENEHVVKFFPKPISLKDLDSIF